jgi:acyl-CoA reductase-like NAD-dependent aldehyde dehydrogenase
MVNAGAAEFVRKQVSAAIAAGATALVDESHFAAAEAGTSYMGPTVLTNVNHAMHVMREESFGAVIGIMRVGSDDEAVRLMNDSPYGLTASIWTQDATTAQSLGDRIETGTVFMNRCDYVDPTLVWTGVKDTGSGIALSQLGYNAYTRPKSFHLKLNS